MRKSEGITLIALTITIILIVFVASMVVLQGRDVIERSQLENIKTNLMLVKAKGKEYAENANFALGAGFDALSETDKNARINDAKSKLKGTEITNANSSELGALTSSGSELNINITNDNKNQMYYYELSTQDLKDMGVSNAETKDDKKYIIRYDIKNVEIETYYTKGFNYDNHTYYSLTQMENLQ